MPALHNTAAFSTSLLWGPFKASKLNLLLFSSLQRHSENCCSSSLLCQMSTDPLSPCIIVSWSKARIGSSDLHFKMQLESRQFKASQQNRKSHFVMWRIRGTSHITPFWFLVGTTQKKSMMGLGHWGGVFVSVIPWDERLPAPQTPSPPCPPHHCSSYAGDCWSPTILKGGSWDHRQQFAPCLHAPTIGTCLVCLWLQLSQGTRAPHVHH